MVKLTPDMFKPWRAYIVTSISEFDQPTTGLHPEDRLQPIAADNESVTFNMLNRRRHVIMPLGLFRVFLENKTIVNNPDDESKLMGYALLHELHVGQKFIVKSELSIEKDGKHITFSEGNVFIIVEKGDPLKFAVEKLGEPPISMSVANFIELGRNGSIDELQERCDYPNDDIPELKLSGRKVTLRTSVNTRARFELKRVARQCHPEDLIKFCKQTLKDHGFKTLD